ncbi:hypothetical protein BC936DRAFT_147584 [Jimgerdemannia flammicorona]|uniref:SWI5-dependent HO expression protein 3 n=1 Tax=Jimgerdemannia flammicorona TaxID=994334 RepID=A0A433DNC9_9FUNG|nr:hypothetical protein BC936DRAFT_147584 [Jimgerdemannia flammicorona]
MANIVSDQTQDDSTSLDRTNKSPPFIISPSSPHLSPSSPHLSGSKAITLDLEEIQRKLEAAQKELAATRAEFDITKREAKTAELAAAEDGRTNRRLRVEVQTLTDQLQRKDRQMEQSKATSFFFEGQLKKYEEEIDAARTGLERFQILEEEAISAKAEAEKAKERVIERYESVRAEIDTLQQGYMAEVGVLKAEIGEVQRAFLEESVGALHAATESEARVLQLLVDRGATLKEVRAVHGAMVGRQRDLAEMVEREVKRLKEVLESESQVACGFEDLGRGVKAEMADVMWKLRTFKVLQASEETSETP